MKIRFLQDYQVKDPQGQTFKQGEIYDLAPDSARHFLSRRRAELIATENPKAAPPPAPEKPAVLPPEPGPGDKDLKGKTDPAQAFTAGQRKYRERQRARTED
jgi:hypothetical protein